MDVIQSGLAVDAVLRQQRRSEHGDASAGRSGAPDFYVEIDRATAATRRLLVTLGAIAVTSGVLVSAALVATASGDVLLAGASP